MNPSYRYLNIWAEWEDLASFFPDSQYVSSNAAQHINRDQGPHHIHGRHSLGSNAVEHYFNHPTSSTGADNTFEVYQQQAWGFSLPSLQLSQNDSIFPDYFTRLPPCQEPPDALSLQRQHPRFEGDLYTAPFIKGEGVEREGWCGFCSSWHRLKDSAFWYHLHYSHGVSCATGKQMIGPQRMRLNAQFNGWQALCARCNTWLTLGKSERAAKTAYYRHAYQCHVRDNPEFMKRNRPARRLQRSGSSPH